jgi:hypothetical protein
MGRTRADLHRLSAHVLGRRRAAVSGHFGLRASPDGIATPAFGPEPEVLRLTATHLIREVGTSSSGVPLRGATLEALAAFAGADLSSDYSAGPETPDLGSTSEPLQLEPEEVVGIFDWFQLGWRVLDTVVSDFPGATTQLTVQLWPEHFDVGTALEFGGDDGVKGVNLGASAGGGFSEEPYVYVGPWGQERPGDPAFWNAPFGAVVRRSEAEDESACVAFLRAGLARLSKAS